MCFVYVFVSILKEGSFYANISFISNRKDPGEGHLYEKPFGQRGLRKASKMCAV